MLMFCQLLMRFHAAAHSYEHYSVSVRMIRHSNADLRQGTLIHMQQCQTSQGTCLCDPVAGIHVPKLTCKARAILLHESMGLCVKSLVSPAGTDTESQCVLQS